MTDRFLAWLSAGLLAAGVSTATIAGAAVAAADDDTGGTTTSSSQSTDSGDATESSGSADASPDSADRGSDSSQEADDDAIAESETDAIAESEAEDEIVAESADEIATEELATEESEEELAVVDAVADESADVEPRHSETGSGFDDEDVVAADEPAVTEDVVDAPELAVQADDAATTATDTVAQDAADVPTSEPAEIDASPAAKGVEVSAPEAEPTTQAAQLVMTQAQEAAPAVRPTLLNVVGSFVWGLLDLTTKLLDFPPAVPPGSTLTVGRSRLEIDCGDGYTTTADWYFPTEVEPETFIYFQHGFAARAGFFNLTLQALAEHNNAIVVAPSITSNVFSCDACAINGEPMQAAAARLFEGDRAALVASAAAAGYEGTLPERFVITGQSAGAHLAAGMTGYYYKFAPADEKSNMAGAILYEISGAANELEDALDRLPDSFPLLLIAAEPNIQTAYGSANEVFLDKRPGQFNGIQLVGGAHSDAFRTSTLFGLTQLIVDVFFGAATPENREAVHVLTQGWVTDMYAGRVYDPQTRTGIYGIPGEPGEVVVDIPTDAGLAHGYILPAPIAEPPLFAGLTTFFLGLLDADFYGRCAVDPDEPAATSIGLTCPA